MKQTIFIAILFMATSSFGQVKSDKINVETNTIKVSYKNEGAEHKKPAYFLNKKLVDESILKTISPNEIANVNVEKANVEIDNVLYYGKFIIETKPTYNPKLISLNNLKLKYTNLNGKSTIFKIDDEIINADYDKYLVDENYILKINIENFENKVEKLNVNFVSLITKSEKNIKKSNEIILRGKGELATSK